MSILSWATDEEDKRRLYAVRAPARDTALTEALEHAEGTWRYDGLSLLSDVGVFYLLLVRGAGADSSKSTTPPGRAGGPKAKASTRPRRPGPPSKS